MSSLGCAPDARQEWPLRDIARDITGEVGAIDVPVAVLAGQHDAVEPPGVLRECLLPHLPRAELTVVPEAGHLLPLESPAAVAAAAQEFLARLGP
ncbi:alpha/beta fold hydrolase [Kitasatospora sp. NPDC051170]|uniref:alpha/beta fold hydrolase n=1 Tax=Kitasatospora sp. NPDC051170 TaxID=3364056 RepID=UPI0037AC9825